MKQIKTITQAFLFTSMIFYILSCVSDSGGGGGSSGGEISLEVLSSNASSSSSIIPIVSMATTNLGQNSVAQLESLKYYIREIAICEDMTISGSGYSGTSGCLTLYSGNNTNDYDTYLADEARADNTNYIDLIDISSLSTLNQSKTLKSDHARSYQYGKIDFYRPLKITATISMDATNDIYTKDGTVVVESGSGLNTTYTNQVTTMSNSPAEETVVVLSNGGSWFKFQNPFTISNSDINNEVDFEMKLTFNPEGVIKGYEYYGTASGKTIHDTSSDYVIAVPFMDFTPIVHRKTEIPKKESYLLHYNDGAVSDFDIRLELFYIDEDSDKTIYGVETKILLSTNTVKNDDETLLIQKVASITTASDNTLSFNNYEDISFISDFTRETVINATNDTATLICSGTNGCAIRDATGDLVTGSLLLDTKLVSIETVE